MAAEAELLAERARLTAQVQRLPDRPSEAEIHGLLALARQVAKEAGKAADLAQHEATIARRVGEDFESDGARRLLSNMADTCASYAKARLMLQNAAETIRARAGVLQSKQEALDTERMRLDTRLLAIEERLRR